MKIHWLQLAGNELIVNGTKEIQFTAAVVPIGLW